MKVRMRDDLAEARISVPASKTFRDYDTQVEEIYVNSEELEGAVLGEDPADSDDHPFCYVELKDGRSLYFMGMDLDFDMEKEKDHEKDCPATDGFGCRCGEDK